MKIKTDFVTNSSSASFILFVETSGYITLEEFQVNWQKYLDHYYNEYFYKLDEQIKSYKKCLKNNWREKNSIERKKAEGTELQLSEKLFSCLHEDAEDPKTITDEEIKRRVIGAVNIKQIAPNVYSVSEWTSMFNGITEDVPGWMIHLIVLCNMGSSNLYDFGIKNVKLEINEDG